MGLDLKHSGPFLVVTLLFEACGGASTAQAQSCIYQISPTDPAARVQGPYAERVCKDIAKNTNFPVFQSVNLSTAKLMCQGKFVEGHDIAIYILTRPGRSARDEYANREAARQTCQSMRLTPLD